MKQPRPAAVRKTTMTLRHLQFPALVAAVFVLFFSVVLHASAVSDRTRIENPRDFEEDVVFQDFVILQSTVSTNAGTTTYTRDTTLNAASTTPCQIQAPTSASSTLDRSTLTLTVSSTTASIVTFAKGAGPTATTSFLGAASVAANAKATMVVTSTSTSAGVASGFVFAPGEYLVIGMAGGTGTFSPTGVCTASFTTIPAS